MVSLDGSKEINDKNRVFSESDASTYDVIVEKLRYMKNNFPSLYSNLQISVVINPSSAYDKICDINFNEMGIRPGQLNVAMVDVGPGCRPTDYNDNFIPEYYYSQFLAYLAHFKLIEPAFVPEISLNLVERSIEHGKLQHPATNIGKVAAPSGPCVPGQSRLFVTVDGNLLPCERVSEASKKMYIGDIYSGINIEKAQTILNIGKISEARCKDCWAFRLCTICARCADNGSYFDDNLKIKECQYVYSSATHELREKIMLSEITSHYRESYKKHRHTVPDSD